MSENKDDAIVQHLPGIEGVLAEALMRAAVGDGPVEVTVHSDSRPHTHILITTDEKEN